MSVGIMDADLSTYLLVPFNLECMKLSTYYKKHNQLVVFSPSFTPERHKDFIYRKDYEDGIYPPNLLSTPNVQYGGLAFSNNKYIALPEEIERMKPDTSLYSKMAGFIQGSQRKDKIWQNMITSEHMRLSLDGKTIWPDYGRQFYNLKMARNLMIHDYDLGAIDGAFEEVQQIMKRARHDGWATRLGMKFPVQIHNGQTLLNWSSFKTNSTFYSIRYDGVIDDDAFNEWVGVCRERAVFSSIEYHVTSSQYTENYFIQELLPKIFKQIIISRSYRVFFSLKYDEGFFTDPRWCEVLQLFNYYHNSYSGKIIPRYLKKIPYDTMYDFVAACTDDPPAWFRDDYISVQHLREIFGFVRENHYELFKLFYECTAEKLGGKL